METTRSKFHSTEVLREPAQSNQWVVVAASPWQVDAHSVRSIHSSKEDALNSVPAVFAEEWKDYSLLLESGCDHKPPAVSVGEWPLLKAPILGDSVRFKDHAVVSLIDPAERLQLHEAFREDSGELDPLANRRPFLVFHANFGDSPHFPDDYTLVARIEAENVEHALFLSQHSDVAWPRYRGVDAYVDNPRSTQIGDVIIDHELPLRYCGPNKWRPATTGIDASEVLQPNAGLDQTDHTHKVIEHRIETQRITIKV